MAAMEPVYASDLTDDEWAIIADLFPTRAQYPNLKTTFIPFRSIVNAILYRTKTGVQYRMLPKEYPPFRRVNEWHLKWERTRLWDRILDRLRAHVRLNTPHADGSARAETPTVAILDSQSVKTTEEAAAYSGYDGGKKDQRPQATPSRRRARHSPRSSDNSSERARHSRRERPSSEST